MDGGELYRMPSLATTTFFFANHCVDENRESKGVPLLSFFVLEKCADSVRNLQVQVCRDYQ